MTWNLEKSSKIFEKKKKKKTRFYMKMCFENPCVYRDWEEMAEHK